MKLNITTTPNSSINGYKNYFLYNNDAGLDLSDIPYNSCTEILFTSIDYVQQSILDNILNQILSKLRINGRLTIIGINLDIICRAGISGELAENEISDIIENIKSVRSRSSIIRQLKEKRLTIDYSFTKGHIYEISAIRK